MRFRLIGGQLVYKIRYAINIGVKVYTDLGYKGLGRIVCLLYLAK
jgi:hypothetical protein